MNDADIDRIIITLPSLAEAGVEIDGSDTHGFELRPPLPESELAAFEAAHSIILPPDYRAFISRVGNGGAGPVYGVFPFGVMDHNFDTAPWRENDGFVGTLSLPFPHTNPWNDTSGPPTRTDQSEAEYTRLREAFDRRYYDSSLVNGAFPVCHLGCALRLWLVVTGPEAGNLWEDNRADFNGLAPLQQSGHARVSFGLWYMSWLDECLSRLDTITAKPSAASNQPPKRSLWQRLFRGV